MQRILETMTSCVALPGAALEGGAQNPHAICFQDHMALSSDIPGPSTVLQAAGNLAPGLKACAKPARRGAGALSPLSLKTGLALSQAEPSRLPRLLSLLFHLRTANAGFWNQLALLRIQMGFFKQIDKCKWMCLTSFNNCLFKSELKKKMYWAQSQWKAHYLVQEGWKRNHVLASRWPWDPEEDGYVNCRCWTQIPSLHLNSQNPSRNAEICTLKDRHDLKGQFWQTPAGLETSAPGRAGQTPAAPLNLPRSAF